MKFNITMENAVFHIDETNKIVVCVINHTRRLFKDFVMANFRIDYDCDIRCAEILSDRLEMPNRFVGIAKCGPNDVWNEDVGCAVAFSRAKDKLYHSFFKRSRIYVGTLRKWLDDSATILDAFENKINDNIRHRHSYIERLIDDNEQ